MEARKNNIRNIRREAKGDKSPTHGDNRGFYRLIFSIHRWDGPVCSMRVASGLAAAATVSGVCIQIFFLYFGGEYLLAMGAGIYVLIIIVVTVFLSYKGFNHNRFLEDYEFEVDRILVDRQYYRLITTGFLHTGWMHLGFNMFSLYIFSGVVEMGLGTFNFLLIYFASLIGGGLLSLLIHRHHGNYSSVGASGAVCGVMFASVALFPQMRISLFPLPFGIPSWLYALLFVGFSIYGIRSQKDNIGHDAHLGGALVGMTLALVMHPAAFAENYGAILLILVPTVVFVYIIITRPELLWVDNLFYRSQKDFYSIDHEWNTRRADQQQEVDRILDKISRSGMGSLSRKERQTLKDYSRKV